MEGNPTRKGTNNEAKLEQVTGTFLVFFLRQELYLYARREFEPFPGIEAGMLRRETDIDETCFRPAS